ncbi:MAG: hypothetical protein EAZ21_16155, partial [Betaproteobacteria bacterium]
MLTIKNFTFNITESCCSLLARSAGIAAIALAFVLSPGAARAQSADPALSTAAFFPIRTVIGTTSELRFTFSNSGSTAIPVGSVELAICPAFNFYTSAGAPVGAFASAFTWTAPGPGDDDCWRGINNVSIAPFGGGQIRLTYNANALTSGPEITNINVQIISSFLSFQNTTGNDNLQPELEITELPELVVAKTASVAVAGAGTNFVVTQEVISQFGCSNSASRTITVVQEQPRVGITGTGVCLNNPQTTLLGFVRDARGAIWTGINGTFAGAPETRREFGFEAALEPDAKLPEFLSLPDLIQRASSRAQSQQERF